MTWQEFDIAMTIPEAYYDQGTTGSRSMTIRRTAVCLSPARSTSVLDVKRPRTSTSSRNPSSLDLGNAIPRTASAVLTQQLSRIRTTFPTMKTWSRITSTLWLALSTSVYDSSLQFLQPRHDICDFIKKCVPSVYKEHGKVISHFGALRLTVQQVCEYAGRGKAKQLGWDRAYNSEGDLCYICYYDGGNAALCWIHESSANT